MSDQDLQKVIDQSTKEGRLLGMLIGSGVMLVVATLACYSAIKNEQANTVPIEYIVATGHADLALDEDGLRVIKWREDPDIVAQRHMEQLQAKDKKIQEMTALLEKSSGVIAELEKQLALYMDINTVHVEHPDGDLELIEETEVVEESVEESKKGSWLSRFFKKKPKKDTDE
jgi:hypothetical protein